jgi:hypothetical protein
MKWMNDDALQALKQLFARCRYNDPDGLSDVPDSCVSHAKKKGTFVDMAIDHVHSLPE